MSDPYHVPALLQEAVDFLISDPAGAYVDGTVGGGGHAEEICRRLAPAGRLICFDADADAIEYSARRLAASAPRVEFVNANVRLLATELSVLSIRQIHGLLLDLGVSSFQFDEGSKGFSFRSDDPLDMRMDRRQSLTAQTILNGYSPEELADIIRQFGEERYAKRVAGRIVVARPLATTGELASAVRSAVGERFLTKSLARVFQALRIAVNDELTALREILRDATGLLAPGGRIVVISYHSLEDRIVKEFFRDEASETLPSGHKLIPDAPRKARLRLLTKKPLRPGDDESRRNPRVRSAKLRAAERTGAF